ncbi:acyl-CoA dehydrogenase [Paraburkholderia ginsengiterrae]|uniref:3-sulfinopropanoyl-CoA desulfinase n=1 Tax=Paraburkholderia ginsengiterrae TaxID=1462993 RepID=A0A1A9N954_9BURK|nr:acyl-CoA dehydrogenase family protein [Paraburkholderia ginsengiterrae]OAJ56528.1 acyl-CoA dehydrogenase [Paraburkholderia ginsengiterrae]OAJ61608.1 acyl-CoA dehydrogenase [Paraburkholderia ginsengiterrae]
MILTAEQQMMQDSMRAFAQEKLLPRAEHWEASAEFPRAALKELGELGALGMTVSEEYGGVGLDYVSLAVVIEEIAAGHGATSTIVSVQNSLVCGITARFGSEAQKKTYLTGLATGELLGCFCLTEPHTGSDASALRTTARRDGDEWVINGVKQFITTGREGDVALVFAVTDASAGKQGISCFILPTTTKGYIVTGVERKLGQHASDTAQITFEDCRVPGDALVGELGQGYRIALSNLEAGRIGIAAQSIGMARAAYEVAVSYARERHAFGIPLVGHQAVAFRLADMATNIEAARQLTWHAAALKDAGQACLKEASMAKLFASEAAEKVCSAAIQTLGGYGYTKDFPVERIYRDVRVTQIYEGTSDVQRIVIGRAVIGA